MIRLLAIKYFLFLILMCTGPAAMAATMMKTEVTNNKHRYSMTATAVLQASTDKVVAIMIAYDDLTSINPYLVESHLLSSTNGTQRVSMVTRTCFMLICYKMLHVQDFIRSDQQTIYSKFIPELSDFKYGWTRWTATPFADADQPTTLLKIELEVEPDFFIMPVIGPRVLKDKLIEITEVTVDNLEKKANSLP